jgi:acyl-CoA synthetase (NDP forming)
LLETEGIAVLEAAGIQVPAHIFVPSGSLPSSGDLAGLTTPQVVVKVNSPAIAHKSDVGGVAVVDNDAGTVGDTITAMSKRFAAADVAGFTVHAFVPYRREPGHELLLGLRWTEDFGAVIVVGAGGIHAEFLAAHLRSGSDIAVVSAAAPESERDAAIGRAAVATLATNGMRGQEPLVDRARLYDAVTHLAELAGAYAPEQIRALEINPLVVHDGELWALDVLVELGDGPRSDAPVTPPRPRHKLHHLLEPKSVAVIGVSQRSNPGRIILKNLIRDGFDPAHIHVIKPGLDELDGCRCYPDIASLPGRVDLFVLAIDASQAAAAVAEIVERRAAESIIVIPGGLEEKSGSEEIVARMNAALDESRRSDWGGPLVNGGNCLGVQSRPGHYDTLFIPEHKIAPAERAPAGAPIAFISQSGAFAVSKNSKLAAVDRKYTITLGNQMDLTIGDYLQHLADDEEIGVYAVYAEGFKPGDGLRFLDATRRIVASGRHVVLYRAGRTAAGARASASHTASIAGDYAVTRALAAEAGAIVTGSIADFEDVVMMLSWLRGRNVGPRVGAVSNAGFECVAIADSLGPLQLAGFTNATVGVLHDLLEANRLGGVVDVNNPLDLTPMTPDEPYEAAVRVVLADDHVDVGVVACVPLTPALNTLPPGEGHGEDVTDYNSVASRIARAITSQPKACVAVVDGGEIYDPMAAALRAAAIPTFRTADRAVRLLGLIVSHTTR